MDMLTRHVQGFAGGDAVVLGVIAIGIIVATFVISRIVVRILRNVTQSDGNPLPSSSILINIARAGIWILGISTMLSACFKVDVNGLLAAVGIGGVALSLGMQDTVKNFIGGLQVTLMGIVKPGDHVIVEGVEGIVQDVSWRQTVVKDYENKFHLIPNAIMGASTVTQVYPNLLVSTPLSFTNDGRDLDAMIAEMELLAKEAVEKVAPLEKDPWILLTQIGEYGTWAIMRFVLKDTTYAREARDAALRAVSPYTRNNAPDVMLGLADEGTPEANAPAEVVIAPEANAPSADAE